MEVIIRDERNYDPSRCHNGGAYAHSIVIQKRGKKFTAYQINHCGDFGDLISGDLRECMAHRGYKLSPKEFRKWLRKEYPRNCEKVKIRMCD